MTRPPPNDARTPVGLAEVVARGDLRWEDGDVLRTFAPSAFDLAVLDLADAAIRGRVPVGFLLPVGGMRVGAVLAAAVLVRQVSESGSPSAKVALASKHLALRPFYRSLHIRAIRLSDYFPLDVVLGDGRVSRLGQQPTDYRAFGGSFRVSVSIGRIASLPDQHEGMVIESGTGAPEEILAMIHPSSGRNPLIYLTTNPFDPVLSELAAVGAVWAWTPTQIAELACAAHRGTAICAEVEELQKLATPSYRILGPDRQAGLDEILPRLWDDLAELQGHGGFLKTQQLRWAWGVACGLAQLAVPVHYFDRHARSAYRTATLGDAPGRAEAFARNAPAPEEAELWAIFASDLVEALHAAKANVKPGLLADWVTERYGNGRGLVVVRNRAAVAATVDFLDERPGIPVQWRETVALTTFADLEAGRASWSSGSTLFSGPVPGARAGLFATPPARELLVLSHGPWESGRAVRQIHSVARRLAELAGGALRNTAILRLRGAVPDPPLPEEEVRPCILHVVADAPRAPPVARGAIWNPFDVTIARSVVSADDVDEPAALLSPEDGPAGEVAVVKVTFFDGVGFFDPDSSVSRVRQGKEDVVAVKSLKPGDRVVLVDRGVRIDLFHLVTTKLEELPEFAPTVLLVREWQARAARVLELELGYADILDGLQARGSAITTPAAISHWVHGRVHGPDDPEDIRRLGEVIADSLLARRWEALGRALKTMRVHRRKVGRMLAHVLDSSSRQELEVEGYFDRRLGLHLSELAEAVSDHTIMEISLAPLTVPAHIANILIEAAAGDSLPERLRPVRPEGR